MRFGLSCLRDGRPVIPHGANPQCSVGVTHKLRVANISLKHCEYPCERAVVAGLFVLKNLKSPATPRQLGCIKGIEAARDGPNTWIMGRFVVVAVRMGCSSTPWRGSLIPFAAWWGCFEGRAILFGGHE